MYLDALGLLSDAQAFPGAATVSTNVIDLGSSTPKREIGTGEEVGVGIATDVAAGAGSTVTVEIIQSTTSAMAAPDVIATLTDIAANFPAGALKFLAIPMGTDEAAHRGARHRRQWHDHDHRDDVLTSRALFSILAKPYAKNYAV
jgi:hypothetical protein